LIQCYRWVFWFTGEAGLADAVVAVDAVFADAVVTRAAGALVHVDLAVGACEC
jgi:hypothetical protein